MEQGLLRTRRRQRRPFVVLCVVSPLVLCLGWTGLWLFAQREAANVMDGWIASEAGRGRQWTCPGREIGGFPLELRLTCSGAAYRGPVDRDIADIVVAGLTATVSLFQPKAVEVSFTSPLTLTRQNQDRPETLSWSMMTMRGRMLPDGRGRLELQTDDPSLQSGGETNAAAHAEVHLAPAKGSSLDDRAYDVWFTLDRGRLPALDASTGEEAPVSIDEKAVLTAVDPAAVAAWPILVEGWRRAGGILDLVSLKLTKGDLRAEVQGKLGLDDAHRLSGALQAALWNYEPLAIRLGIPPRALSVGNALSKLLSRGSASAKTDPPSIKLPVTFSEGRVAVGPVVTSLRLAPFY